MKKGFTLIELLAVILVLGIIALIAIPVVNNITKEAKEKAEMRSVEGYAQALENAYYLGMLKEADLDISALIPNYKGAKVTCEIQEFVNEKLELENCNIENDDLLFDYKNDKVISKGKYIEPADNELVDTKTPVFTLKREYRTTQKVSIRYPEGYTNEYSIDNGKTWHTYSEPLLIDFSNIIIARTMSNNKLIGIQYYYNMSDECKDMIGKPDNISAVGEKEVKITCPGMYKMEVWGAQGGTYSAAGGYGAYAVGTIFIPNDTSVFVNVGGAGSYVGKIGGAGYNGGGNSGVTVSGGGGGATHIAYNKGLLSTLSASINKIIIVAGGGGGAGCDSTTGCTVGGHAGGIIGGINTTLYGGCASYSRKCYGSGGTQSAGGARGAYETNNAAYAGTFGKGGAGKSTQINTGNGGGGGGGFYGGGGACYNSGGGGSSYIGNTNLFNKEMYCYNNCTQSNDTNTKTIATEKVSTEPVSNYVKKGNGYARITYLGKL